MAGVYMAGNVLGGGVGPGPVGPPRRGVRGAKGPPFPLPARLDPGPSPPPRPKEPPRPGPAPVRAPGLAPLFGGRRPPLPEPSSWPTSSPTASWRWALGRARWALLYLAYPLRHPGKRLLRLPLPEVWPRGHLPPGLLGGHPGHGPPPPAPARPGPGLRPHDGGPLHRPEPGLGGGGEAGARGERGLCGGLLPGGHPGGPPLPPSSSTAFPWPWAWAWPWPFSPSSWPRWDNGPMEVHAADQYLVAPGEVGLLEAYEALEGTGLFPPLSPGGASRGRGGAFGPGGLRPDLLLPRRGPGPHLPHPQGGGGAGRGPCGQERPGVRPGAPPSWGALGFWGRLWRWSSASGRGGPSPS
jgi:hypothetical protein